MRKLALFLTVFAMAIAGSIDPELEEVLLDVPPDSMMPVIVHTSLQADLGELPPDAEYDDKIDYLQEIAGLAQQDILAWLDTTDAADVKPFWLVSRIALTATPAVIESLAEHPDVEYVIDDSVVTLELPDGEPADEPDGVQWNVTRVAAPACWGAGYDGTGIVVGCCRRNTGPGVALTGF